MRIAIVGAGSAGCVLANRLSASGRHEVFLLESGPDYAPDTLPEDLADGHQNAMVSHDWRLKHRVNAGQPLRFPFPRGRVVGGSSAVNTCIALRGQPADYDEWSDLGLRGWGWSEVLPAFCRLENDLDFGAEAYHGEGGPLPLARHAEASWTPWQSAFVQAATALGHPRANDSNAPGSVGVGPHTLNQIRGRRISAAEAWLTPDVRARTNLRIVAGHDVERLRFRGRAVRSVEVVANPFAGAERLEGEIEVDRVILSAGAIHTPRLLLRSGIGPRERLDRHGIAPVAINPGVASRLLDHPGCAFFLRPASGVVKSDAPLMQTVLRVTSDTSSVPGDWILQPGSKVPMPRRNLPLCSLMFAMGKPKGQGTLHFRTLRAGPPRAGSVRIASGLLDNAEDRENAVRALGLLADLAEHPAMRACARFLYPSRSVAIDAGRRDRWVLRGTGSGYHPSGTVPMGAEDDPSAALDADGALRGVEGVRVADASVFPTIPSSNIHLPTLMVAEHLAERWNDAP